MTKRIPKTPVPENMDKVMTPESFDLFCDVYIPQAPHVYTYGVQRGEVVQKGSVVWVQFNRRKIGLAVVSRVFTERPHFKLKRAVPHLSHYIFSERYMENLEWTAKYYLSSPMTALHAFLPSDFPVLLDAALADILETTCPSNKEAKTIPPCLTREQKEVVDKLTLMLEGDSFRGALLHGVTGSGKTRVYQEVVEKALSLNKKVLILVPEIGLTPQSVARFSDFLNEPVYVLHSALSKVEKRKTWVEILLGRARVVLGTRSAILAPFDFDLVILDEEHDSSYKQQDPAPRYHCRELAFHLAHKHGALVVLGSATPSVETFSYAKEGNLSYFYLSKRATDIQMPKVHLIDMKKEASLQQTGILLSSPLREALTKCLDEGHQAIILMNRRGYSKTRVCSGCGATLYCKNCHIPLVYHKQHRGLLCHYCGCIHRIDAPCFECGSPTFEFQGGAIEKLEEEIISWIPSAKVVRMDRDTTQNIGSAEEILTSFRDQEYNVLLGTQMVAKGHDFPRVQLVGIVGADIGTGIPDFRMSERLFQLLSQTAGRAGRNQEGGEVWIQTMNPTDPLMRFALTHDYEGFIEMEIQQRREACYPPFCKLLSIEVGARDQTVLQETVQKIETLILPHQSVQLLGPVEGFIPMLKKTFWMRFLVKAESAVAIRNAIKPLTSDLRTLGIPVNTEIKLDMDP
ncbi:MAG TPA: primosomal protein N' [Fibrobacteraceae bacterium]|jgi:primosomal protein N' (replication factor Y)|nr:primosomal protein N' [Fibrobacter sp.]HPW94336.1 primosomal protein N' [Fibrobacteraceae bacterium]